jgi:fibronectin-binding autotransporter adhesin
VDGATTLSSTLGVTGAATLSSTLGVTGAATLSSTLGVTGASTLGRSTISGATGATVLKGGTNSGTLTLQDGNTVAAGATPAGTSITISGSGGGTAATVFQTTTNAGTTSVTTAVGTSSTAYTGSTAILQAGSNAVTVNSGNVGDSPGVRIDGVVRTGSTSTTGVLITGSGQNSQPYTTADRTNGVAPTWADVAIQSKSYGLGDPTLGSAILITDYGIQMISPQPITGQLITNNTGINNSTGNMVNNSGMNTSSGSVTNNTGGNSGSGSATNNLGMNSSTTGGTVANNIGGISGNGNVTNMIGQNNGTGIATNGFGTGSGVTNNFIGNNNPGSTVQLDGGSSRMTLNGNGATFSNPSTGGPIQVHGVADGSSPHDAVNVRQLFSGVAASMATAPTVTNMKPGDAGVGVGFGQYGGYSAMGINLTYYARNEAQLNLGVARSMQSGAQTAIRASVGFKF